MNQDTQRANELAEYRAAAADLFSRDERAKVGPSFEQLSAIGVRLLAEFNQAELDRRTIEDRLLRDLRQYKGRYDPEVMAAIDNHRSRAFLRKTRVKVNTVDARVFDLLFPASADRNWTLGPTPRPSLAPEQKRQIRLLLKEANDGEEPTKQQVDNAIKQASEKAAAAMQSAIDDQLVETAYRESARKVLHSGHLFGTGILKAPLVERRVRTRFVYSKGKWVPRSEVYFTPFVEYVPIWRWYPDMSATRLEDCRYVYERHTMTRSAMLGLAERKSFNKQAILDYIEAHPDGAVQLRYADMELREIGDRDALNTDKTGQYELLERWGWLTAKEVCECGVKVPESRMHESFFANVWVLPNGTVIKAVMQPINGVTWPYKLYYFDKDETSIFGEGLASIMRDDQEMLNAALRMMLDHAAVTSGPQFDVNVRLLTNPESANDIYPFKVWTRTGENPDEPAVRVIDIPNNLQPLANLLNLFENNADEVSAIPRYVTGDNPTSGAAGTSSGLSMLMGNVSIVLKDRVTSYDEGVTKPFITDLYRWNMQFNPDSTIKGDFDVKACGTASLVAKEIRARQLNEFTAMLQPEERPFVKWDEIVRQKAQANEFSDVVKTKEDVDEEMANPQAQAQQQLAAIQAQLEIRNLMAVVAKMEAEVAKLRAETVNKNVASAYAAMQAGGTAVQHPHIAPAGDEILRSAGWTDATPGETNTQAVEGGPGAAPPQPTDNPVDPAIGPGVGMMRGSETAAIE